MPRIDTPILSTRWRQRAMAVMPGGVQTRAKEPRQWGDDTPRFVSHGFGGHVWDLEGNEWIDLPMALGAVLLGHGEPSVTAAITRQAQTGISFTLMHTLEVEVAERIVAMCPGVEAIRFTKTGSEAATAAVRLARAATGREKVVVCGYHGWHDWCAAALPQAAGVPAYARDLAVPLRYGDLDSLATVLSGRDVAAVVIEPLGSGEPSPAFLRDLVEQCGRAGTVSVFDEVQSGFRIAPGGAREKYGVRPDLSCYGKALGNGMPIAAVAGDATIMADYDRTGASGTNAGETLSLAAAKVVLDTIADGSVLAAVAARGREILDQMRRTVRRHDLAGQVRVEGDPARPVITCSDATEATIRRHMARNGILFNGRVNLCARHSEADISATAEAFEEACAALVAPVKLAHGDEEAADGQAV